MVEPFDAEVRPLEDAVSRVLGKPFRLMWPALDWGRRAYAQDPDRIRKWIDQALALHEARQVENGAAVLASWLKRGYASDEKPGPNGRRARS